MQVENSDLKSKVRELTDQISTLEMIVSESQEEMNKSRVLIGEMTG